MNECTRSTDPHHKCNLGNKNDSSVTDKKT